MPGQSALRGHRVELNQPSSLKFTALPFNIFFTLMSRETRGILSESVFSRMRTGFDWIYVIMNFLNRASADIYPSRTCSHFIVLPLILTIMSNQTVYLHFMEFFLQILL